MTIGRDEVIEALRDVPDPELPVSIVDLGLVEDVMVDETTVRVRLVTTFMACPGRRQIADGVRDRIHALFDERGAGPRRVDAEFDPAASWSPDRVTEAGRAALADVGCGWGARCPHCGSESVDLESSFGSSVCSARAYCRACRTPFELMKGARQSLPLPTVRR